MEELEKAWQQAWSIPPGQGTSGMTYIGEVRKGKRLYKFYKDQEGGYKYESFNEQSEDYDAMARQSRSRNKRY